MIATSILVWWIVGFTGFLLMFFHQSPGSTDSISPLEKAWKGFFFELVRQFKNILSRTIEGMPLRAIIPAWVIMTFLGPINVIAFLVVKFYYDPRAADRSRTAIAEMFVEETSVPRDKK
jgi:hypothetical protein